MSPDKGMAERLWWKESDRTASNPWAIFSKDSMITVYLVFKFKVVAAVLSFELFRPPLFTFIHLHLYSNPLQDY